MFTTVKSLNWQTLTIFLAALSRDAVDRILLINPATTLQGSFISFLNGLLPNIPAESKPFLPLLLAPALGNPLQLLLRGIDSRSSPAIVASQLLEVLSQSLDSMCNLFRE